MPTAPLAPSLEEEIAPDTAAFYRRALHLLVDAGIPFLVGGAFAHACFTGIRRSTKDLDLFIRREDFERVASLMEAEGWRAEIAYPHWLAKVYAGEDFIDLIFNSGNGVTPVDDQWFRNNVEAEVLGVPVRLANMEDGLLSKAFIMERERYDGADIAHLIRGSGREIDWQRLLSRFGPYWRMLLAHLVQFGFIYPSEIDIVPAWLIQELTQRLRDEADALPTPEPICRGTLLSRAQYLVDIEHWGYRDARLEFGHMHSTHIEAWTDAIATEQPTPASRPTYREESAA
jgi:hypothetical protein